MKEDSAWRRREKGDLYLKYTHTKEIHCYSDATAFCILILDNLSPTTSLSLLFLAPHSQKKLHLEKKVSTLKMQSRKNSRFAPQTLYFWCVCLRVLSIPLWLFSFMKIESDMTLLTI